MTDHNKRISDAITAEGKENVEDIAYNGSDEQRSQIELLFLELKSGEEALLTTDRGVVDNTTVQLQKYDSGRKELIIASASASSSSNISPLVVAL